MREFAAIKRSKDRQAIRYLIVDDSIVSRKHLGRMIESFGGEIAAEAADGLGAIAEYDRVQPDIVLMDVTMPQMDGIGAAEAIIRRNPQARILMVSSVGYQENILAALQSGARHFIQKPVRIETLYDAIQHVLAQDGEPVSTLADNGLDS